MQIFEGQTTPLEEKSGDYSDKNDISLKEEGNAYLHNLYKDLQNKAKSNKLTNKDIEKKEDRQFGINENFYIVLDEQNRNIKDIFVCDYIIVKGEQKIICYEQYDYINNKISEKPKIIKDVEEIDKIDKQIEKLIRSKLCFVFDKNFYYEEEYYNNENAMQINSDISKKCMKKCLYSDNMNDYIISMNPYFDHENKSANIKIYKKNDAKYSNIMNKEHWEKERICLSLKGEFKNDLVSVLNSNSADCGIILAFLPVFVFKNSSDGVKKNRVCVQLNKEEFVSIEQNLMKKDEKYLKCLLSCAGFNLESLRESFAQESTLTKKLVEQIVRQDFYLIKPLKILDFKQSSIAKHMTYLVGSTKFNFLSLVWDGRNFYFYNKNEKKFFDFKEIKEIIENKQINYSNIAFGFNYNCNSDEIKYFNDLCNTSNYEDIFIHLTPLYKCFLNEKFFQKANDVFGKNFDKDAINVSKEDDNMNLCLKEKRIFIDEYGKNGNILKYAILDVYYQIDDDGNKQFKNIVLIKNFGVEFNKDQMEEKMNTGELEADGNFLELKPIYYHDEKNKEFVIYHKVSFKNEDLLPVAFYFDSAFNLIKSSDGNKFLINKLKYSNEVYEIEKAYLFKPEYDISKKNISKKSGKKIFLNITVPIFLLQSINNEKRIISIFDGMTEDYNVIKMKDLYLKNKDNSKKEINFDQKYKQMIDPCNLIDEPIDNETLVNGKLSFILKAFDGLEMNVAKYISDYGFIDSTKINEMSDDLKEKLEKQNGITFVLYNEDKDMGYSGLLTYPSNSENCKFKFCFKLPGENLNLTSEDKDLECIKDLTHSCSSIEKILSFYDLYEKDYNEEIANVENKEENLYGNSIVYIPTLINRNINFGIVEENESMESYERQEDEIIEIERKKREAIKNLEELDRQRKEELARKEREREELARKEREKEELERQRKEELARKEREKLTRKEKENEKIIKENEGLEEIDNNFLELETKLDKLEEEEKKVKQELEELKIEKERKGGEERKELERKEKELTKKLEELKKAIREMKDKEEEKLNEFVELVGNQNEEQEKLKELERRQIKEREEIEIREKLEELKRKKIEAMEKIEEIERKRRELIEEYIREGTGEKRLEAIRKLKELEKKEREDFERKEIEKRENFDKEEIKRRKEDKKEMEELDLKLVNAMSEEIALDTAIRINKISTTPLSRIKELVEERTGVYRELEFAERKETEAKENLKKLEKKIKEIEAMEAKEDLEKLKKETEVKEAKEVLEELKKDINDLELRRKRVNNYLKEVNIKIEAIKSSSIQEEILTKKAEVLEEKNELDEKIKEVKKRPTMREDKYEVEKYKRKKEELARRMEKLKNLNDLDDLDDLEIKELKINIIQETEKKQIMEEGLKPAKIMQKEAKEMLEQNKKKLKRIEIEKHKKAKEEKVTELKAAGNEIICAFDEFILYKNNKDKKYDCVYSHEKDNVISYENASLGGEFLTVEENNNNRLYRLTFKSGLYTELVTVGLSDGGRITFEVNKFQDKSNYILSTYSSGALVLKILENLKEEGTKKIKWGDNIDEFNFHRLYTKDTKDRKKTFRFGIAKKDKVKFFVVQEEDRDFVNPIDLIYNIYQDTKQKETISFMRFNYNDVWEALAFKDTRESNGNNNNKMSPEDLKKLIECYKCLVGIDEEKVKKAKEKKVKELEAAGNYVVCAFNGFIIYKDKNKSYKVVYAREGLNLNAEILYLKEAPSTAPLICSYNSFKDDFLKQGLFDFQIRVISVGKQENNILLYKKDGENCFIADINEDIYSQLEESFKEEDIEWIDSLKEFKDYRLRTKTTLDEFVEIYRLGVVRKDNLKFFVIKKDDENKIKIISDFSCNNKSKKLIFKFNKIEYEVLDFDYFGYINSISESNNNEKISEIDLNEFKEGYKYLVQIKKENKNKLKDLDSEQKEKEIKEIEEKRKKKRYKKAKEKKVNELKAAGNYVICAFDEFICYENENKEFVCVYSHEEGNVVSYESKKFENEYCEIEDVPDNPLTASGMYDWIYYIGLKDDTRIIIAYRNYKDVHTYRIDFVDGESSENILKDLKEEGTKNDVKWIDEIDEFTDYRIYKKVDKQIYRVGTAKKDNLNFFVLKKDNEDVIEIIRGFKLPDYTSFNKKELINTSNDKMPNEEYSKFLKGHQYLIQFEEKEKYKKAKEEKVTELKAAGNEIICAFDEFILFENNKENNTEEKYGCVYSHIKNNELSYENKKFENESLIYDNENENNSKNVNDKEKTIRIRLKNGVEIEIRVGNHEGKNIYALNCIEFSMRPKGEYFKPFALLEEISSGAMMEFVGLVEALKKEGAKKVQWLDQTDKYQDYRLYAKIDMLVNENQFTPKKGIYRLGLAEKDNFKFFVIQKDGEDDIEPVKNFYYNDLSRTINFDPMRIRQNIDGRGEYELLSFNRKDSINLNNENEISIEELENFIEGYKTLAPFSKETYELMKGKMPIAKTAKNIKSQNYETKQAKQAQQAQQAQPAQQTKPAQKAKEKKVKELIKENAKSQNYETKQAQQAQQAQQAKEAKETKVKELIEEGNEIICAFNKLIICRKKNNDASYSYDCFFQKEGNNHEISYESLNKRNAKCNLRNRKFKSDRIRKNLFSANFVIGLDSGLGPNLSIDMTDKIEADNCMDNCVFKSMEKDFPMNFEEDLNLDNVKWVDEFDESKNHGLYVKITGETDTKKLCRLGVIENHKLRFFVIQELDTSNLTVIQNFSCENDIITFEDVSGKLKYEVKAFKTMNRELINDIIDNNNNKISENDLKKLIKGYEDLVYYDFQKQEVVAKKKNQNTMAREKDAEEQKRKIQDLKDGEIKKLIEAGNEIIYPFTDFIFYRYNFAHDCTYLYELRDMHYYAVNKQNDPDDENYDSNKRFDDNREVEYNNIWQNMFNMRYTLRSGATEANIDCFGTGTGGLATDYQYYTYAPSLIDDDIFYQLGESPKEEDIEWIDSDKTYDDFRLYIKSENGFIEKYKFGIYQKYKLRFFVCKKENENDIIILNNISYDDAKNLLTCNLYFESGNHIKEAEIVAFRGKNRKIISHKFIPKDDLNQFKAGLKFLVKYDMKKKKFKNKKIAELKAEGKEIICGIFDDFVFYKDSKTLHCAEINANDNFIFQWKDQVIGSTSTLNYDASVMEKESLFNKARILLVDNGNAYINFKYSTNQNNPLTNFLFIDISNSLIEEIYKNMDKEKIKWIDSVKGYENYKLYLLDGKNDIEEYRLGIYAEGYFRFFVCKNKDGIIKIVKPYGNLTSRNRLASQIELLGLNKERISMQINSFSNKRAEGMKSKAANGGLKEGPEVDKLQDAYEFLINYKPDEEKYKIKKIKQAKLQEIQDNENEIVFDKSDYVIIYKDVKTNKLKFAFLDKGDNNYTEVEGEEMQNNSPVDCGLNTRSYARKDGKLCASVVYFKKPNQSYNEYYISYIDPDYIEEDLDNLEEENITWLDDVNKEGKNYKLLLRGFRDDNPGYLGYIEEERPKAYRLGLYAKDKFRFLVCENEDGKKIKFSSFISNYTISYGQRKGQSILKCYIDNKKETRYHMHEVAGISGPGIQINEKEQVLNTLRMDCKKLFNSKKSIKNRKDQIIKNEKDKEINKLQANGNKIVFDWLKDFIIYENEDKNFEIVRLKECNDGIYYEETNRYKSEINDGNFERTNFNNFNKSCKFMENIDNEQVSSYLNIYYNDSSEGTKKDYVIGECDNKIITEIIDGIKKHEIKWIDNKDQYVNYRLFLKQGPDQNLVYQCRLGVCIKNNIRVFVCDFGDGQIKIMTDINKTENGFKCKIYNRSSSKYEDYIIKGFKNRDEVNGPSGGGMYNYFSQIEKISEEDLNNLSEAYKYLLQYDKEGVKRAKENEIKNIINGSQKKDKVIFSLLDDFIIYKPYRQVNCKFLYLSEDKNHQLCYKYGSENKLIQLNINLALGENTDDWSKDVFNQILTLEENNGYEDTILTLKYFQNKRGQKNYTADDFGDEICEKILENLDERQVMWIDGVDDYQNYRLFLYNEEEKKFEVYRFGVYIKDAISFFVCKKEGADELYLVKNFLKKIEVPQSKYNIRTCSLISKNLESKTYKIASFSNLGSVENIKSLKALKDIGIIRLSDYDFPILNKAYKFLINNTEEKYKINMKRISTEDAKIKQLKQDNNEIVFVLPVGCIVSISRNQQQDDMMKFQVSYFKHIDQKNFEYADAKTETKVTPIFNLLKKDVINHELEISTEEIDVLGFDKLYMKLMCHIPFRNDNVKYVLGQCSSIIADHVLKEIDENRKNINWLGEMTDLRRKLLLKKMGEDKDYETYRFGLYVKDGVKILVCENEKKEITLISDIKSTDDANGSQLPMIVFELYDRKNGCYDKYKFIAFNIQVLKDKVDTYIGSDVNKIDTLAEKDDIITLATLYRWALRDKQENSNYEGTFIDESAKKAKESAKKHITEDLKHRIYADMGDYIIHKKEEDDFHKFCFTIITHKQPGVVENAFYTDYLCNEENWIKSIAFNNVYDVSKRVNNNTNSLNNPNNPNNTNNTNNPNNTNITALVPLNKKNEQDNNPYSFFDSIMQIKPASMGLQPPIEFGIVAEPNKPANCKLVYLDPQSPEQNRSLVNAFGVTYYFSKLENIYSSNRFKPIGETFKFKDKEHKDEEIEASLVTANLGGVNLLHLKVINNSFMPPLLITGIGIDGDTLRIKCLLPQTDSYVDPSGNYNKITLYHIYDFAAENPDIDLLETIKGGIQKLVYKVNFLSDRLINKALINLLLPDKPSNIEKADKPSTKEKNLLLPDKPRTNEEADKPNTNEEGEQNPQNGESNTQIVVRK